MKLYPCLLLLFLARPCSAGDTVAVYSPDKKIQVIISVQRPLSYTIQYAGKTLLAPSFIDLEFADGKKLSDDLRIRSTTIKNIREIITSPVPEKRKQIPDDYSQLVINFRRPFRLLFRVYNDGVAYRIVTDFKDSIEIKNETAHFTFKPGQNVLLPLLTPRKETDRYHSSFEELYQSKPIDSLEESQMAYSPVLVGHENDVKVAITESDLEDYPGMFIGSGGAGVLKGLFAPYPLEEKMTDGEFPQAVVTKRANFIAKTSGRRAFPWRVFLIATEDKNLPQNDLVYRLGAPSRIKDASWILPGKGTDEWIIGINLFHVPFRAGLNTATYKFYIDFAKRFGFNRIMMDAGWSNYRDLFDINPAINMDTLAAYAKANHIKLSMWTLCSTLDRQLEPALAQFNKWGVDFIMTDFMDRDDQKMVNFYHRIAKACAERHIMIMYHGAFPPKGFNRTWPHAVTREGVLGSEYNIWSNKPTPEHDVTLPFTRMLAGPLDYEPGLLENATKDQFRPLEKRPMSQGTRCHQLAMFVVYDSPIQIFSGNPSQGLLEPGFMELLGSLPTTWDETIILEGKAGDYIVTARKKGKDWFIAGMTDWSSRQLELSFDFLQDGTYTGELCTDGINADTYPADYSLTTFGWEKGRRLSIKMAPGGGFLLKLTKAE
jgi:alpha-glucosidase